MQQCKFAVNDSFVSAKKLDKCPAPSLRLQNNRGVFDINEKVNWIFKTISKHFFLNLKKLAMPFPCRTFTSNWRVYFLSEFMGVLSTENRHLNHHKNILILVKVKERESRKKKIKFFISKKKSPVTHKPEKNLTTTLSLLSEWILAPNLCI